MSTNTKVSGADYLVKRSDLARELARLPRFRSIVVFEDRQEDSDRMLALVHRMLGYEAIEVRRASTLTSGIDLLLAKPADLVLLDDRMGPVDRAEDALPLIWRSGYDGPIVVVSSELTRERRIALMKLGITEAVHKDDLDSGSMGELMARLAEGLVKHQARQPGGG
jgi:DNA-binding response OmpR family regulator